jgi:2-deoxy-D-gluconate 3-dehydrogenase
LVFDFVWFFWNNFYIKSQIKNMDIIPHDKLLNLSGKTAIVTGGSIGIGWGISYRLAEAGANVVIASRNQEEADKTVSELNSKGWKTRFIKTDVADEAQVQNLVSGTVNAFGSVDILVNNAGIYPFVTLEKLTAEVFDKVIAINLKGLFLCTKYVSRQMIKQGKGGRIINITSIDALHPSMIGLAHYDASKHGAWGFTKNTALELAQHKIWVNAIAPGGVNTPGTGGKADPSFTANIPMKRMGDPDDIGKVALFLASDMASYMTGSQIVVDGGVLIT